MFKIAKPVLCILVMLLLYFLPGEHHERVVESTSSETSLTVTPWRYDPKEQVWRAMVGDGFNRGEIVARTDSGRVVFQMRRQCLEEHVFESILWMQGQSVGLHNTCNDTTIIADHVRMVERQLPKLPNEVVTALNQKDKK